MLLGHLKIQDHSVGKYDICEEGISLNLLQEGLSERVRGPTQLVCPKFDIKVADLHGVKVGIDFLHSVDELLVVLILFPAANLGNFFDASGDPGKPGLQSLC